jgi:hypothetical protein
MKNIFRIFIIIPALFSVIFLITNSIFAQQIFDQINFGLSYSTAGAIAINNQNHVFIGTLNYSEGIYFSTNNGLNWSNTKPHANVRDVNSIAINSAGTIIAGLNGTTNAGKGVFVSTDNGTIWTKMSTGLPVASVASVAIGVNGYVYAAVGKEVYRSTDTCKNWILKSTGLSTTYSVSQIVCSSTGNIYLFQYKSIYRSTDYGDNWTIMENGWVGDNIWYISVNKKGYIFISTNQNYIYRSTNNGDSFSKITSGLTVYNGKVFSTGENSKGDMFAGSMNTSTVATLYRSTDDGLTWLDIGTAVCYNNLALLTFDSLGFLYASCGGALYKTKQSTLTGVVDNSTELVKSYYLYQNYPNPFNPSTMIGYQIPINGWVILKLFNILGQEVITLVNENKKAGRYGVELDGSSLSSGIYIYRINAGSFVESQKLLLVK